MTVKSVRITALQHELLLEAEHEHSPYDDMRIALIEDYFLPSDCAYRNEDGTYDIDKSAYIHAERKGFDWALAAQGAHGRRV